MVWPKTRQKSRYLSSWFSNGPSFNWPDSGLGVWHQLLSSKHRQFFQPSRQTKMCQIWGSKSSCFQIQAEAVENLAPCWGGKPGRATGKPLDDIEFPMRMTKLVFWSRYHSHLGYVFPLRLNNVRSICFQILAKSKKAPPALGDDGSHDRALGQNSMDQKHLMYY